MGALLAFTAQIQTTNCCRCGIEFGMPEAYYRELLRDHSREFFCPAGHGQHFLGETEAEKLKRQLDRVEREKKWAEEARDSWRKQQEATERSRAALKGVITRTKHRVGNGVCPCCRRTFRQLARHMAKKHPGYAGEETES